MLTSHALLHLNVTMYIMHIGILTTSEKCKKLLTACIPHPQRAPFCPWE